MGRSLARVGFAAALLALLVASWLPRVHVDNRLFWGGRHMRLLEFVTQLLLGMVLVGVGLAGLVGVVMAFVWLWDHGWGRASRG